MRKNLRFSRALGQVFLKDKRYIKKILAYLDNESTLLEIGPGRGELTESLALCAKTLYCVEIDCRLFALLKNKFSNLPQVNIIHGDILKFSLNKLGKKLVICGNIPYQISNRLIKYLVNNRGYIKKAYLMFQKEFAQKLLACQSSSHYGFLSCYLQYYAKIEKLFDVPAESFVPRPKVDSSFCKLQFFSCPPYHAEDEEFLFKVIAEAFTHRRKKIVNALSVGKDKCDIFSEKINPNLRAENIALEDFVWLANKLRKYTNTLGLNR